MNKLGNIYDWVSKKNICFLIISITSVLCASYDKVLFNRDNIPFSSYDMYFYLRLFFIISIFYLMNKCYEFIRNDRMIIAFSFIYACIFLVGDNLYKNGNLSQIGGTDCSLLQLITSLICGLYYRTVIFLIILGILTKVLDVLAGYTCHDIEKNRGKKQLRNCILVLIICWIPYYVWLHPGIVAFDEVTMLMHFFNIDGWGTHPTGSPMLTELLLSIPVFIFHQFGNDIAGIFVCSTIQFIMCICAFSFSLWILSYYHCNKIVLYIVTLIYSLVPVFPMYAMSLCKDTIFSCALLVFILCFTFLQKSTQIFYSSNKLKLLFSFSFAFCCLTRNGAIVLAVAPCIIYLIYHKKRWRDFVRICVRPLVFIMIFSCLTEYLWGSASYNPFSSVMYQQTALYTIKYCAERSEEEIDKINKILDYDRLVESYYPDLSDNVRRLEKTDVNESAINEYKQIWINEGIRHPLTYMEAFTHNNYLYYYPFGYSEWSKLRTNTSFKRLEKVLDIEIDNENSSQINAFEDWLKNTPFFGLMISCGFYSCLFLLTIFLKRHKHISLINSIPIMLIYVSCLFLPANGNFRYILAIVFCTPYYFGEYFLHENGK